MRELNRDEITKIVKDAVYAGVGAGVLTAEQFDRLRAELTTRLAAQIGTGKDRVEQLASTFEAQACGFDDRMKSAVGYLEERLTQRLDDVQERLPEPAGEAVAKVRKVGADARQQLRSRLQRAAA